VSLPEHWQALADGGAMRLWPHRTETDGFYGAMLVKQPV
jgi:16S rRNA C967 or C1407 C5-methylase (RsmB/RsmF family)